MITIHNLETLELLYEGKIMIIEEKYYYTFLDLETELTYSDEFTLLEAMGILPSNKTFIRGDYYGNN